MATLTVSPNPAAPAALVAVAGSGFSNLRIRLLLDGSGATTDIFRARQDGTFAVGRTVSSTPKTQTLVAQQQSNGSWLEVARTSIVVKAPGPPPDTTAPTISAVAASGISQSGATISWNLSEPATGQVEYGPTTSYGSFTTPELSFNFRDHSQPISGLAPGTQYHYRVKSRDQAGNLATSGDFTFTTLGTPQPSPPAPTGFTATPGDRSVTLRWT